MRHDKAQRLLELARLLSSSAEGLSLDEIAREMSVARRTAERMRDAVTLLFPQIEEVCEGALKRFRIPRGIDVAALVPTKDELLELTKASRELRAQGQPFRAAALETLELKVRSALKRPLLIRLGPDIAALAQTEVTGVRVGPRPYEDPVVISAIRHAILAMKALRFCYKGGSRPGTAREVTPCGVLFDRWNYLIGFDISASAIRTWRLDRISGIEVTSTAACPPPGFSLGDYVKRSFGIYQDAIEDVVLKVAPHGAEEALHWVFHPDQKVERCSDGSVLVSFRSGGMVELAWHLFTWDDKVEILNPPRLSAVMAKAIASAASRHNVSLTLPV